jgi:hypothetical protein
MIVVTRKREKIPIVILIIFSLLIFLYTPASHHIHYESNVENLTDNNQQILQSILNSNLEVILGSPSLIHIDNSTIEYYQGYLTPNRNLLAYKEYFVNGTLLVQVENLTLTEEEIESSWSNFTSNPHKPNLTYPIPNRIRYGMWNDSHYIHGPYYPSSFNLTDQLDSVWVKRFHIHFVFSFRIRIFFKYINELHSTLGDYEGFQLVYTDQMGNILVMISVANSAAT